VSSRAQIREYIGIETSVIVQECLQSQYARAEIQANHLAASNLLRTHLQSDKHDNSSSMIEQIDTNVQQHRMHTKQEISAFGATLDQMKERLES
jgi:hypothetical protein